ncbi:MAG: 2-dehydropantoate 2-reductase [Anaeromyxobacteraceae bacterium]
MRIAVIGSGALGLYYGAKLQRAGNDVRFLLRRDHDAISRGGLTVTSPDGDFQLERVQGFRRPEEMGEVELVLVGLKTFDDDKLVELCRPLMRGGAAVLTLQNGLGNEELLAEAFGAERVLGGVAFLGANRGEPGVVHHLGKGQIRLGELRGGLTGRARALSELFSKAGVKCEPVADLLRARWEKLVWNIPFNGLCALTGLTTDRLMSHAPTRREIVALMQEVIAGANAQGFSEPIDRDACVAAMIEQTVGLGAYKPSMMIDREEGRRLELGSIYAVPVEKAAARGVELVRVRMLWALLDLPV